MRNIIFPVDMSAPTAKEQSESQNSQDHCAVIDVSTQVLVAYQGLKKSAKISEVQEHFPVHTYQLEYDPSSLSHTSEVNSIWLFPVADP